MLVEPRDRVPYNAHSMSDFHDGYRSYHNHLIHLLHELFGELEGGDDLLVRCPRRRG